MHAEILDFLRDVRRGRETGVALPSHPDVIEVGSIVMHGTPREVFESGSRSYVGIDWRAGPGVDVVGLAHEALDGRTADLVVCCQMLEHDPFWRDTVTACMRAVRPGGLFVATWAGPGYPEHELETAPPTPNGAHYYENRTLGEVARVAIDARPDGRVVVAAKYGRGTLDALMWARVEESSG